MNALMLTQSQQSAARLPGTWRLDGGRALTLRPRADGVLRIAEGSSWLTFDGPHEGPLNDLGDRVLGAGEQLRVRAGQRLVLESTRRGQPVYFTWDFAAQPQPQRVRTPRRQAVAQSWGELQAALALAARAGWRLLRALGALASAGLRPRLPADRCAAM